MEWHCYQQLWSTVAALRANADASKLAAANRLEEHEAGDAMRRALLSMIETNLAASWCRCCLKYDMMTDSACSPSATEPDSPDSPFRRAIAQLRPMAQQLAARAGGAEGRGGGEGRRVGGAASPQQEAAAAAVKAAKTAEVALEAAAAAAAAAAMAVEAAAVATVEEAAAAAKAADFH